MIERLMRARITEKPSVPLLTWLQRYYQTRGNVAAELEITRMLFRVRPLLRGYQELRNLARQLHCWEHVQSELLSSLEEAHNTRLLIQIALDEGNIDTALHLLKAIATKDHYSYTYATGSLIIMAVLLISTSREQLKKRDHVRPYNSINSMPND